MHNKICLYFYILTYLFSLHVESCSTFLLEKNGHFLVAKSYDWINEEGLVIVNQRNIAKQAITPDHPMQWISKYGSIVFSQAGREFPMGGINEVGLVVELMWLENTTYPSADSRPTVSDLQWIQYQLDTANSIEDVLKSDQILRIADDNSLHYMVIDRTGNCAVIEFIDGQMVAHTRKEMLATVLTNDPYQRFVEFLKKHQGFGGKKIPSEGYKSLDRFVRIATLIHQFSLSNKDVNIASAFLILATVANFEESFDEVATFGNMAKLVRSRWNIVYDVVNKEIHFLTKSQPQIRTIQLEAFNFNGNQHCLVLDMQAPFKGNVSQYFIPYTYELNRKIIDHLYQATPFLRNISEESREMAARYPEKCYCVEELVVK